MVGIWSANEPSVSRTKFCSFLKTIGESFCIKKICNIKKAYAHQSSEKKKTKKVMLCEEKQEQEQKV
jgi:hypothetical protein